MTATSSVYNELNKAWKSTCRILLKDEVGELEEFKDWLFEYTIRPRVEESEVSGKDVSLGLGNYCNTAKFMRFEEISFDKKFEPLNINEIKDIDRIVEALGERFYYSGNLVLGNSRFVEGSSNVHDSNYILESNLVYGSRYVAYTYLAKQARNVFGGHGIGAHSDFTIRCYETYENPRCFELWNSRSSNDCYYVYNLDGCGECLFSINLKGKRHHIGNLGLAKDRYFQIKEKLIGELREKLSKDKKVFGIIDLLNRAKDRGNELEGIFKEAREGARYTNETFDQSRINKSFEDTTQAIFGKKLGPVSEYSNWLMNYVNPIEFTTSVISGRRTGLCHYCNLNLFPKNRLIKLEEADFLSEKLKVLPEEIDMVSLDNVHEMFGKIAYSTNEYSVNNQNVDDCVTALNSIECFMVSAAVNVKSSGYSFWPRDSNHMFGVVSTNNSSFCINAYHSIQLSRAFEVDNCANSSDIYFSHNCENVHDSMFCFNSKNLSYSVGNAQLPRDQYKVVKDSLVGQIADELIRNKDLKWDIYNIGCKQ